MSSKSNTKATTKAGAKNAPPAQAGNQPGHPEAAATQKDASASTPNTSQPPVDGAAPAQDTGQGGGNEPKATLETMPGQPGPGVQVDGQGLEPIIMARGQTHLRVAARVDGFRRCGRAWPATGATVAKADFTADQVAILLTDPDLVVTEVTDPAPLQAAE